MADKRKRPNHWRASLKRAFRWIFVRRWVFKSVVWIGRFALLCWDAYSRLKGDPWSSYFYERRATCSMTR